MAPILRIKTRWSGFNGAPGYTVMHFRDFGTGEGTGTDPAESDANAAVQKVRSFFGVVGTYVPPVVTLQVENEVDLIESTTGNLIDSFSAAPVTPVVGVGGDAYSAAAGAVINWRTAGVRNSRRVRGRTFLVPLATSSYGNDGQLLPGVRTGLQTAAASLQALGDSPDLGVYARPTTKGGSDGQFFVTSGSSVPSMSAILRSRRD